MTVTVLGLTFNVTPLNCSGHGVAFISPKIIPVGEQGRYYITEIKSGRSSISLRFTVVSVVTQKINQHLIGAVIE